MTLLQYDDCLGTGAMLLSSLGNENGLRLTLKRTTVTFRIARSVKRAAEIVLP